MKTWIAILLSCVGCGDDVGSAPDASIDSAPPCAVGFELISGRALQYGMVGGALPYARICVEGRSELCTAAGTIGSYLLCVPADSDYVLRNSAPGYETVLYPIARGTAAPIDVEIGSNAFVASLWTAAGATFPPAPSHIFAAIHDPQGVAIADATVAIAPAKAPVYGDPMQTPAAGLTATSTSGSVYFGDVAVGTYDLTVTSATHPTCAHDGGGFAAPGAAMRVTTAAGATTFAFIRCTP